MAAALLAISLALKLFVPASPLAHAQGATLGQLAGNAWSDTIGWVSFDSTVVTVQNNGTITGYAWSDNIGWVSFYAADTASCGATPAQVSITGTASGWTKALAADNNDWDGCISLSGVTLPGGTGTSGSFAGNAWGSDVVGWVDFSGVTFASAIVPPAPLSVVLTATPARVAKNQPTTLNYTVTSPPVGGCTLTGNGMSPVTINPTSGVPGSTPSNAITSNTVFTLTCGSASATANVGNLPAYIEI